MDTGGRNTRGKAVVAYRPILGRTWDGSFSLGCEARWYESPEAAAGSLGFSLERVEAALASDGKLYIWNICYEGEGI